TSSTFWRGSLRSCARAGVASIRAAIAAPIIALLRGNMVIPFSGAVQHGQCVRAGGQVLCAVTNSALVGLRISTGRSIAEGREQCPRRNSRPRLRKSKEPCGAQGKFASRNGGARDA